MGKFPRFLIAEICGSEVSCYRSTGDVAEVGRVSVKGVRVEDDKVASFECHPFHVRFTAAIGNDADRAHFVGIIDERNPGGCHLCGCASEPARFLPMPVVVHFSGITGLFVEKLIVPKADAIHPGVFSNQFCQSPVPKELGEGRKKEGSEGILARARAAGSGARPRECGLDVVLAPVVSVLCGSDLFDFLRRKESPHDKVAFLSKESTTFLRQAHGNELVSRWEKDK